MGYDHTSTMMMMMIKSVLVSCGNLFEKRSWRGLKGGGMVRDKRKEWLSHCWFPWGRVWKRGAGKIV